MGLSSNHQTTRRAFLLGAGSTALVTIGGPHAYRYVRESFGSSGACTRVPYVPTGKLAAAFEGGYPVAKLNMRAEHAALWRQALAGHSGDAKWRRTADAQTRRYACTRVHQMSIEKYLRIADRVVDRTARNIDWGTIQKIYEQPDAELSLLREATKRIDGRALLAYALTEHRGYGDNGKRNRAYFDFLLQRGGREFVESKPSTGLSVPAFGLYQFTSAALNGTEEIKCGASCPNQALPKRLRIPDTVDALQGDDQFRAAYLYAIHNLAHFIASLRSTDRQAFVTSLPDTSTFIPEFIAAAHNHPYAAYKAGERWIRSGGAFMDCFGKKRSAVRTYVRISAANYFAL